MTIYGCHLCGVHLCRKVAMMHTTSKIETKFFLGNSLSISPEDLIATQKWLVLPDVNFITRWVIKINDSLSHKKVKFKY